MTNNHSTPIELPSLHHPDAWEDPIYFDEKETPNIPASLLPGVYGEFAAALATAAEIPESMAVLKYYGLFRFVRHSALKFALRRDGMSLLTFTRLSYFLLPIISLSF